MSKSATLVTIIVWLAAMTGSSLNHSWILDLFAAGVSLACGVVILVWDPRTEESRKFGYKPIGVALMLGGIAAAGLAIWRRFILF